MRMISLPPLVTLFPHGQPRATANRPAPSAPRYVPRRGPFFLRYLPRLGNRYTTRPAWAAAVDAVERISLGWRYVGSSGVHVGSTYRENVAGKYSVGWDACMYVGSRCVGESTCYIETDTNVCSCSLHVCFGGVFFLFFLSTSEEICVSSCVLHSGLQGIGRWIDRRDFFLRLLYVLYEHLQCTTGT